MHYVGLRARTYGLPDGFKRSGRANVVNVTFTITLFSWKLETKRLNQIYSNNLTHL